jgi:hypothetical protein
MVRFQQVEDGETGGNRAVTFRLSVRLVCVLVVAAALVACQHQAETAAAVDGPYFPGEGDVGFDILPVAGSEGSQAWLAVYTDQEGKTTKFRIELGPTASSGDKNLASGQGRFLAETGSDPIPLLESLKKVLQAKRMPRNVTETDTLPFDYIVLGENQTRSPSGFHDKPKGNWTAMKISLAKGKGAVLLNVNPVSHKAEFSIKDPAYGDIVLAELAKVL